MKKVSLVSICGLLATLSTSHFVLAAGEEVSLLKSTQDDQKSAQEACLLHYAKRLEIDKMGREIDKIADELDRKKSELDHKKFKKGVVTDEFIPAVIQDNYLTRKKIERAAGAKIITTDT